MARRFTAELGDWVASLRFSGFTVLTLGLLVVGALILTPTLSTYVQQQREIAELRASVACTEQVAEIDAERLNWQDPAYVRQARGRLFYVMPGRRLSVIDDVLIPAESDSGPGRAHPHRAQLGPRLAVSTLLAGTTDAASSCSGRGGSGQRHRRNRGHRDAGRARRRMSRPPMTRRARRHRRRRRAAGPRARGVGIAARAWEARRRSSRPRRGTGGSPFPAFYLCHPEAVAAASRSGRRVMAEYNALLAEDELRVQYRRAHEQYIADRDSVGGCPSWRG